MRCDAILNRNPGRWIDDTPFMLWEIGYKTVIEHWVDTLYETNSRLFLWLEEVDSRLLTFANETFPLCRNTTIRIGTPPSAGEACTYLDENGTIVVRPGDALTPYLPRQLASKTWFALVKSWLRRLGERGSATPEIEREIHPGVFVGHHCNISRGTIFTPPCWIGSYSTITEARIGPFAVVGENCVVSHGTRVVESYVLRNTFLGENLSLEGMVASGDKIMHHESGALASVADRSLLLAL